MQAAVRFAVFVLLLVASGSRIVLAMSSGAPVAACGDLTQRHAPAAPADCGSDCPFSVSVVEVDGEPVSGLATYKCGSLHTRESTRLEYSGG